MHGNYMEVLYLVSSISLDCVAHFGRAAILEGAVGRGCTQLQSGCGLLQIIEHTVRYKSLIPDARAKIAEVSVRLTNAIGGKR